MELAIMTVSFFFMLFSGIPLLVAMVLASVAFMGTVSQGYSMETVFMTLENALESFPLLAVPLFIIAGELINHGGLGKRVIHFVSTLLGFLPGGLGIVSVGSSMVFAGLSGSAVADSSAIGSVMIPGMEQKGYSKAFAAAIISAAGTIGVIIPPSIPMIIYSFVANVSLAQLFIAGAVPGVLIGLGLMFICVVTAIRRGYEGHGTRPRLFEILRGIAESIPAILFLVIILGGIFGGIFTPTEAAAVAVVYGFLLGIFFYQELKWRDIPGILLRASILSASILIVVGAAAVLSWALTAENVPKAITDVLLSFTNSRIVFLLILNIFLLILGMFMDAMSGLMLSVPLFLPVATAFGIDPVHLGVIMVCNLAIGLYTPPVGPCLYVATKIGNVSIGETTRELIPFFLISLLMLAAITYIPELSLWLTGFFR